MSNDIYEVEASVLSTMDGLIKDPLNIIGYLIVLFFLSYQLTLFIFVLFPLIGLLIGRLSRSLKKDSGTLQKKYGHIMNVMDETLGNMRIIKAFTAENFMTGKFVRLNKQVDKIKTSLTNRKELASPLSEFLGVVVLCTVFWYGGRIILDKSGSAMDADQFISYIAIFGLMINPAKSLSTSYYNLQKGGAAAERIEQILFTPDLIIEKANPVSATAFNNAIEFKNVSFKYDDTTILSNVNFSLPKGTTVALVGSSGAGKSTLADLLPRFHEVSEGEILIDGINIKDYSISSLRGLMGIVTQEPLLFNDSIKSNIALGVENPPQQEIEHAAAIANAHAFITQKEEGYNSNIGERGNKLSGGERQRLTIARAVFKNPPILILDEATSSLDTESERLVQDAIDNLMQERTSLVIAHRLSTVRHANLILVLQKGVIVERGTHDELIASNGFYKKLVDMQEVK
jgi:subfamily B ATP-binding cassette protein MsbA